jgi:hypothetical protein
MHDRVTVTCNDLLVKELINFIYTYGFNILTTFTKTFLNGIP